MKLCELFRIIIINFCISIKKQKSSKTGFEDFCCNEFKYN